MTFQKMYPYTDALYYASSSERSRAAWTTLCRYTVFLMFSSNVFSSGCIQHFP